jgi:hypothetical protein
MEIQTKFNIDDSAWMMHDNKTCFGIIEEIRLVVRKGLPFRNVFYPSIIYTTDSEIEITYSITVGGRTFSNMSQNRLFSTKEELLLTL